MPSIPTKALCRLFSQWKLFISINFGLVFIVFSVVNHRSGSQLPSERVNVNQPSYIDPFTLYIDRSLNKTETNLAVIDSTTIAATTTTKKTRSTTNRLPKFINMDYLSTVHESAAAASLPRKGTLFCWVLTSPKFHDTRVYAVNDTWINRCDHGQFFTSSRMSNESIPYSTVFSELSDRYDDLFGKTRVALFFIWHYVSPQFNWYLKADDDTYIIVENLRKLLNKYDPNQPYFVGFRMKPYLNHGYNSGGAGYVLSRGALRIYYDWVHLKRRGCESDASEDVGLGRCLAEMGIFPIDTRDDEGRQRFNGFGIDEIFYGRIDQSWFMDPIIKGSKAFSKEIISFHHVSPEEMRLVEVLLYTVSIPNYKQDKDIV